MDEKQKQITAALYREQIMNDPAVHYWVKSAIKLLEEQDAVDACFDAKMVYEYFELRLNQMQKEK